MYFPAPIRITILNDALVYLKISLGASRNGQSIPPGKLFVRVNNSPKAIRLPHLTIVNTNDMKNDISECRRKIDDALSHFQVSCKVDFGLAMNSRLSISRLHHTWRYTPPSNYRTKSWTVSSIK